MLTVVCMLWHDPQHMRRDSYTYSARHVLGLQQMVARHLTMPHRFVCWTDRPDLFDHHPEVTAVPLDMATHVPGTFYAKLALFRGDIRDTLGERILYLDLDCVVTGSLDDIAGRPEPLVLWRNPVAKHPKRSRFNSSMILLSAGCRPDIYETFDPLWHPGEIRYKISTGMDQAWISHLVPEDAPSWDHADGVYHARRPKDDKGVEAVLPDNARIVFFPGRRVPWMPDMMAAHPWIAEHLPC